MKSFLWIVSVAFLSSCAFVVPRYQKTLLAIPNDKVLKNVKEISDAFPQRFIKPNELSFRYLMDTNKVFQTRSVGETFRTPIQAFWIADTVPEVVVEVLSVGTYPMVKTILFPMVGAFGKHGEILKTIPQAYRLRRGSDNSGAEIYARYLVRRGESDTIGIVVGANTRQFHAYTNGDIEDHHYFGNGVGQGVIAGGLVGGLAGGLIGVAGGAIIEAQPITSNAYGYLNFMYSVGTGMPLRAKFFGENVTD